jgi:hypothetical protein
MGYAPDGRERFVDPEMQNNIYGALGATGGNAMGTVLVNGEAHGSWDFRFEGDKMNAKLNMFTRPTGNLREDIESELSEIAGLFKAKSIVIENKVKLAENHVSKNDAMINTSRFIDLFMDSH